MGKKIARCICVLGILVSIRLIFMTGNTMIRDGYARDAGIYISNHLGIVLGLCAVTIPVFAVIAIKCGTFRSVAAGLLLLALLSAAGVGENESWHLSYQEAIKADPTYETLLPITLSELKTALEGDSLQIIYVGGNDYQSREAILPELAEYLESEGLDALYYNTGVDSEVDRNKMERVLEKIPVDEIPTVFVTAQGETAAIFTGERMVEELRSYLDSLEGNGCLKCEH